MDSHSDIIFDLNPLAEMYHRNNLELLICQMQNGIDEFRAKAPHRGDYISATEIAQQNAQELVLWLKILWEEYRVVKSRAVDLEIINLSLLRDRDKNIEEINKLVRMIEEG